MTKAKIRNYPETAPRNWIARIKKQFTWIGFLFIAALIGSACPVVLAVDLNPSKPPFDLRSTSAHFIEDIAYGPHERHKLDIFIPTAAYSNRAGVPLVIFIHGGGFSSGSKEKAYRSGNREDITRLLDNDIAYASINYPLLDRNDQEGLIKSLLGAKRALQFIRQNHKDFHIDPDKVVLLGSSAGASTGLWLALHDDMANLNSRDPVEHQSTRVLAAVAVETQASMDIVRWEEVFQQYNFSVESMGKTAQRFYGVDSMAQLYSSAITGYRQDVDLLRLMDASDPEVWVANENVPLTAPSNNRILYHHPYHARALRDQASNVGLKGYFYIPKLNIVPPRQESMTDFILRKVKQG